MAFREAHAIGVVARKFSNISHSDGREVPHQRKPRPAAQCRICSFQRNHWPNGEGATLFVKRFRRQDGPCPYGGKRSVLHACTRKDRRNVPRSLRISTATRFPGPFTANSTCETATPSTFFLSPTTLGAELVSTYSAIHSWPQSLHDFCHISTSPGAGATVFRAPPQCGKKCLNILTDKPPAAFNLSRLAQQQPRQHE